MAKMVLPECQLIYDGTDFGLVSTEFGIYYIRDAHLTNLSLLIHNNFHEIYNNSGGVDLVKGWQDASLSIEVRGGLVERSGECSTPYDLQLVRNMKVIDLLTEINKRLCKRNKK